MPPVTPMPRPVVVAGAVTAQRWTAPFIADERDGTDWRELRHGIEHRLERIERELDAIRREAA